MWEKNIENFTPGYLYFLFADVVGMGEGGGGGGGVPNLDLYPKIQKERGGEIK